MQWIAPPEKDTANGTLEKRLWDAADQFRANSGLTAAQYSQPVLGLIFLRFAKCDSPRSGPSSIRPLPHRGAARVWTTPPRITLTVCSISHREHGSTTSSRCPKQLT